MLRMVVGFWVSKDAKSSKLIPTSGVTYALRCIYQSHFSPGTPGKSTGPYVTFKELSMAGPYICS